MGEEVKLTGARSVVLSKLDQKNWSDGELSRKAHISKSTVSRIRNSQNYIPDILTIVKIEIALGFHKKELLTAYYEDCKARIL